MPLTITKLLLYLATWTDGHLDLTWRNLPNTCHLGGGNKGLKKSQIKFTSARCLGVRLSHCWTFFWWWTDKGFQPRVDMKSLNFVTKWCLTTKRMGPEIFWRKGLGGQSDCNWRTNVQSWMILWCAFKNWVHSLET